MNCSVIELIKILAWPVTTIWLAYYFRPELRELLKRLSGLKYGDAEIKFASEASTAAELAERIESPSSTPSAPESTSGDQQLQRLAGEHPRAAVLVAWLRVEAALDQVINPAGPNKPGRSFLLLLDKDRGFDPQLIDLIKGLRNMRNEASHNAALNLSVDAALSYITAASKAIRILNDLAKKG